MLDTVVKLVFPFVKGKLEKELSEKPRSFGVEPNNVCNARCSFCAYRLDYDKRPKGFVDEKVLNRSLELFTETGESHFSFISILGDPLADKNLLKKIKKIKTFPQIKDVNIYSNLIGLRNFDMDEFVASGITVLSISTCLGGREMYKKLFGVDEYENVIANLLKLLEANVRQNNPFKILLLLRMDSPPEKHLDTETVEKIRKYLPEKDFIYDVMWDDYNGMIKESDLPKGESFRLEYPDRKIPCYALYRKIQVLYNGDMAVCSCRVGPELVMGNVFDCNSLEDYWKGEKLRKFRERWKSGEIPDICRNCTHYQPFTLTAEKLLRNRIRSFFRK